VSDTSALSHPTGFGETRVCWVRGLVWDGFWLQSALWLAPLALLLAFGYEDPGESPLDWLIFGLTAVFWISHRLGSTWLAYATTAYRPLMRAEPSRYVLVPVAIATVCFAILLPGDDDLPFSRSERVLALTTLDFALVTYHFAAQHFGVLSLYRVRSGRGADIWTRRLDRVFALGVGGALVVVVEAVLQTTLFQNVWTGPWVDTEWIDDMSGPLRIVAETMVIAVTFGLLIAEARSRCISPPRILYIAGVALMVSVGTLYGQAHVVCRRMGRTTLAGSDGAGHSSRLCGAGVIRLAGVAGFARNQPATMGFSSRAWRAVCSAASRHGSRSDRIRRHILWRPPFRLARRGVEGVGVGARSTGHGLFDRIPALLA
jgi:hypothetical protein